MIRDVSFHEAGTKAAHDFPEIDALVDESDADAAFQQLPKIDKFRAILSQHAAKAIDGTLIDAQSANAVVLVYDNLSPEKQQQFVGFSAFKMAQIAWKLVK